MGESKTVMNYGLLYKLRAIKVKDILSFFLFLIALPLSGLYKMRRKQIWLLCEYEMEAKDNAYWLFRYLRENHPQVDAVYALHKNSADIERVCSLGEVVHYGSLRHWIYYLAAQVNISSQKGGKPNAAVCYVLEVLTGLLKNKRVFLQHGIIKDDLPYLHYDKAKLGLFMCSARDEYNFVKEKFGYPEGSIVLTGLCRYDNLLDTSDGTVIALMPTWREWLYHSKEMERVEAANTFCETQFYKMWSELLCEIVNRYPDKQVVLCLHRNMQQYNCYFENLSPQLQVLSLLRGDVAELLKKASLLITDYSSVAMDFAYLEKPLLYYQADYGQFRRHHLPEGYFDYEQDGFGEVCHTKKALLENMDEYIKSAFKAKEKYIERKRKFFSFNDKENCHRNYIAIENYLGKSETALF